MSRFLCKNGSLRKEDKEEEVVRAKREQRKDARPHWAYFDSNRINAHFFPVIGPLLQSVQLNSTKENRLLFLRSK